MDARFALLLACFLLSGFAALLYQTVWTRELSFVFGTSELAVAAVLAAYMGGLSLGSAVAARYARRLRRPVLAYGVLELAIALSALAVPAGIRAVNALYLGWLGGAADLSDEMKGAATLFQVAAAFAVLLLPTAFMGATLPLLARHVVRREQEIGSRVGVLYAVNTTGAIVGTLCAAFWLMPALGLRQTVWVGAASNALVFALAALLARGAPLTSPDADEAPRALGPGAAWILPAILISGATSFAYEVMWTRLLGHVLGASLQAFATMLASFLLGIALGSAAAARFATTRTRALTGFATVQVGIAVASYAAFAFADHLPQYGRLLGAGLASPLPSAGLAVTALLPITLCIGATFPFAVRFLAQRPEDAASITARVYAWNTVGAIVGALGAGFVVLPALGFEGTLTLGVALNLFLALGSALVATPRQPRVAAIAAVLGLLLVLVPARTPWSLLRESPLHRAPTPGEIVFYEVGRSSTVVVVDHGLHFSLATSGLPEAAMEHQGSVFSATTAHWLGLLPALIRPEARDMLVVGLGGGAALESVPSSIEAIDVIELEPAVVAANRAIAPRRARDPLSDPRIQIHIGDARGALQLSSKHYDAIVSQPSHPWTAGASHLYTREFFALVRSRLNSEGVFVQWIALPFVDDELLRSLLASLVETFGHVELYAPSDWGLLFIASQTPLEGVRGAMQALREHPEEYARYGLLRPEDFASSLFLDEEGVRALADGAPPNTDDDNRLAARASRLGIHAMDPAAAAKLLAPYEPLLRPGLDLDRSALVRGLMIRGYGARAEQIAKAGEGIDRERALGWMDLTNQRPRSAARHFERALAEVAQDPESLAGLVESRRSALTRGPVPEVREDELDPFLAALVDGWRFADRGEWDQLEALEGPLAGVEPGHLLYDEGSRLRADWRLQSGDPQRAAEAAEILERLLVNLWLPGDALAHAQAATAAGDRNAAWISLGRIAESLPRNARGRDLARQALEVAKVLPDDGYGAVRAKLAKTAQTARGG